MPSPVVDLNRAYRLKPLDGERSNGRDPLLNHDTKHRIAVRPTTFMVRLPKLLGAEACERLQDMVEKGGFRLLRERALYVDFADGAFVAPSAVISSEQARETLLLALECADDILVGYTNHSYELGKQFEKLIEHVAAREA
jgi:hypothetical protein